MKKLILLLLFIPILSLGQDQTTVVGVKSTTKIVNERELVLSEASTNVRVPLTADLNNYTHILLVNIVLKNTQKIYYNVSFTNEYVATKKKNDYAYKPVQNLLELGFFEIVNPYVFDSKRFKKEPLYLKTIKKESYLYLYLIQRQGKGDDINTTIMIRDWKNKLIYSATHINVGLNDILAPLTDF